MTVDRLRNISLAVAGVAIAAVLLSLIWHVPYLYTFIGVAAWAFVGHIVTADDDAPGGWSDPHGAVPFPWHVLAIKAAILALLVTVAVIFPSLRTLGGG